jgi:hydroxypyruvate reductase/glycerate 2-kinase
MSYVKNSDEILSHGNVALRRAVLDILDSGLEDADPGIAARRLIRFDETGKNLFVGERSYVLSDFAHIYVLGAGKATFPIAKALDDILGSRITAGIVTCKNGQKGTLKHCLMRLASHPIPDEAGLLAAKEILNLAQKTKAGDLVFACITGGSSALMPLPIPEITLDDKKFANKLLLTCGANIIEINAVRKHLSLIKGGLLAQAIHKDALLINLTVSDVIGDPLDYITDPTVPDTSSFEDAQKTLDKYDLWDRMPPAISSYLKKPPLERETPKSFERRRFENHILVPGDAACNGAVRRARELGYEPMILSTMLEGESRELGRTFGFIAGEILRSGRPLEKPCAVIGGGETTVYIDDKEHGTGGPNQEFALGAALEIGNIGNVVVAGLDSDGTDGPTNLAGGIVDNHSMSRAHENGLDIFAALKRHDTTAVLQKLGDAIFTGNTGTNVNDLKIMVVGK